MPDTQVGQCLNNATDEVNKRYIIAEESSNMKIDSIPFSGVKGRDHYWCDDLSHNYIN